MFGLRKLMSLFGNGLVVVLGFMGKFSEIAFFMECYGASRGKKILVFENKSRSSMQVREAIITEVGSWLLATPEFNGFPLSLFLRDWVSSLA